MRIVDLFGGLGGWTTAAHLARLEAIWAANHSQLAVYWHRRNHPWIDHVCQDLCQYNFGLVPDHDLALMSPCCQGHSRGRKRGNALHDASRATAWAVVSLLEAKRPPLAIVENVPEFTKWALFPAFKQALAALGYAYSLVVSDAADSGAPQNRVRLFIVLTRSKAPLQIKLPRHPHRAVSEFIQWDAHKWTPIKRPGRSLKTLARVERARAEIGWEFVMPYYSKGSGLTGRSLDRPLGTLTTKARWAVVRGDHMRMLQPEEARAIMSFPAEYQLPANKGQANHLLGNAVCPAHGAEIIRAVLQAA